MSLRSNHCIMVSNTDIRCPTNRKATGQCLKIERGLADHRCSQNQKANNIVKSDVTKPDSFERQVSQTQRGAEKT